MIEALLHGKLSRRQKNMEDILTSNVFGMLQYAPTEDGLFKFLAKATTTDGQHPLENLTGATITAEYHFWPRWPTCEPDVVLHIKGTDSRPWLVAIEAKYRSGKSSEADENDERPNDQLVREWLDLVVEADRLKAQPVLVYLTADVSCPGPQIQDSLNEYHRKCKANVPFPVICWLSWRELPELFCGDSTPRQLRPLARMAEEKMGLFYFRGIRQVASILPGWKFQSPPAAWHFRSDPIIQGWTFQEGAPSWCFRFAPITCQWGFQEPTPTWHSQVAPIKSQWRFKR